MKLEDIVTKLKSLVDKNTSNITKILGSSGDTFTSTYTSCYGYISTGGTVAFLYFSLPKMYPGNKMTITKLVSEVRHVDGGYLGGSSTADLSSYISTVDRIDDQNFRVQLENSSGWGITNNTPLIGVITITGKIS